MKTVVFFLLMTLLWSCATPTTPQDLNDPTNGAREAKPGATKAFEGEGQMEAEDPALQNGPPSVFKPNF